MDYFFGWDFLFFDKEKDFKKTFELKHPVYIQYV